MKQCFSLLMVIFLFTVTLQAQTTGSFTDPRDGMVYKTIEVGTQTWFAQNLNFDTAYSYCIDCNVYGRVYMWEVATKACPAGWHLPGDGEFTALVSYLGGFAEAGGKMKEAGLNHWKKPNFGASNASGLNVLPHGYRSLNGILNFELKTAWFWTSTNNSPASAWSYKLVHDRQTIERLVSDKICGMSVRCVKN